MQFNSLPRMKHMYLENLLNRCRKIFPHVLAPMHNNLPMAFKDWISLLLLTNLARKCILIQLSLTYRKNLQLSPTNHFCNLLVSYVNRWSKYNICWDSFRCTNNAIILIWMLETQNKFESACLWILHLLFTVFVVVM